LVLQLNFVIRGWIHRLSGSAPSVIMLSSGWGEMRYDEGKYGGAEQVLIVTGSTW
jgi:hypothetical protein